MGEKIYLHHVCLHVSKLNQSEIFYNGFLGLKKLDAYTVPAEYAKTLFDIQAECRFISFECPEGGGLEIFSTDQSLPHAQGASHFCLGVSQREKLIETLRAANVTIREIAEGDRKVVFILDPDDNLIELKEIAS
ncbi:VOC family protein [bacterium]|nr:VOC family protein [bacterium]